MGLRSKSLYNVAYLFKDFSPSLTKQGKSLLYNLDTLLLTATQKNPFLTPVSPIEHCVT